MSVAEEGVEHEAEVHGAADILKDPLHRGLVSVAWSMHMEAHLLNSILQLRPGESEVLESTNNGPVERSIRGRRTISGRELGLRIDRRSRGFAVKHPGAVKELTGVLPLVKEEAPRPRSP